VYVYYQKGEKMNNNNLTVFTVTEYDENDDYKRAQTYVSNLGTFKTREAAEAAAAQAYTDRYLEAGMNEESEWYGVEARINAAKEWNEMHAKDNSPSTTAVLEFFAKYGDGLWEPEFINETTYRVEISKSVVL